MARAHRYLATDLSKKAPPAEVDVEPLGDDRYLITLDGERLEVEAQALPGGAMTLRLGARTVVAEFEERGDEVGVLLSGQVSRFDVVDERKGRLRAATASFEAEGKQTVLSPMPGKVVKVFVKPGDAVTEGQGLVVVEAMKMENELKSPKAGTVVEVFAKEGSAVENGAKLVVVE
ncbi:MAG: biotin/lipoyl-binding protein [Myxococcaceae bacterium]|jgi:biotin carboxyl carrier protein|nr:biotin/lipoyl-binding protein [Myxococcaceae bacterium]